MLIRPFALLVETILDYPVDLVDPDTLECRSLGLLGGVSQESDKVI